MNGAVMVEVVRYFSGARLRIRSWFTEFSVLKLLMVLRHARLRSPMLKATGGRRDRRMTCPSLRLRAAEALGPPVTEVDWYWLVAKISEAPTPRELRSMSDVVKKG